MRICVVYDCLYPWTVGGAERWTRTLAEALAADGHEVTYLTRRQWEDGAEPRIDGVRVVAVSRAEPLYGPDGNRTISEPLRFGWGVFRHLVRHRRSYDVVHTGAFPYFALLGCAAALWRSRVVIGADWFEVWSRTYWREYLGGPRGWVGWAIQRRCARVRQRAFVFSRLHGARLREEGLRGEPVVLAGLYAGGSAGGRPRAQLGEDSRGNRGKSDGVGDETAGARGAAAPTVVFAGRHIAEKRVPAIPPAVALARREVLGLRAVVYGDGPQRPELLRAIDAAGAAEFVDAPGFVDADVVADGLAGALCLLLPSQREGYGLVVIEAAAAGTPVVVAAGPDNAAVELVAEGENGFVAASDAPEDLAAAIVRVARGGDALRASTAAWFEREAPRLTAAASVRTVLATYAGV